MDTLLIFINHWAVSISGFITALGIIILFIKRIMKKLKPHLEILENLQKLTIKINEISKEFKPNGGHSVRDTLNLLTKDIKANMEITKNIESIQTWTLDVDPTPIFYTDEAGACSYANTAYCQLLKRPKEEILGNGWKNCLIQEKRQEVINDWIACVNEKRAFERFIEIEDKNGKEYVVKVTATRTSSGKYLGTWTQINPL
jgi:PAS domain S-box-containing protein